MDMNDSRLDIPKALTKGLIAMIPIVGSVLAELIGYADSRYVDKRIQTLEQAVLDLGIKMDDFIERLRSVEDDEHKYFVVRNNIKHLCLSALPETVDMFNKALIEVIMKDEYGMAEYATEIIKQLNSEDIAILNGVAVLTQKDGVTDDR